MHTIPRKTYHASRENHSAAEHPASLVENLVEKPVDAKESPKAGLNPVSGNRLGEFCEISPAAIEAYSDPSLLLALRDRDEQALRELFQQEGIEAIEADIDRNLHIRCPEPFWEDDSFEFLRDYL
jgi:hypothetical protein